MKNRLLLLFITIILASNTHSQIIINEIMQSNVDCLMEKHQFPDSWVELYNNSENPAVLKGFRIGTNKNFESAYKLPDLQIPAGSYKIIFCNKEAYDCHTDFALEIDKGNLYLFNSEGEVIDLLKYKNTLPVLPVNISYGKYEDQFGYMKNPTPGAPNTKILNNVLPQPLFNKPGKVYPLSQKEDTIIISMPSGIPAETKIHYTLDGSEPNASSLSATELKFIINTTTIIRAKLVADEYISPYSVTQSYIFHPRELTLPVVSVVTDSSYLYGENHGILVSPNFKNDWYRPLNFEYFDSVGNPAAVNQLGETRVQGAGTRVYAQKSLAIYERKRYGYKKFYYQFWPEDKPYVTSVKSFILRNGGNDCTRTHLRDAFAQYLFSSHIENLDWQAYTPAVCYINGAYKGIYNIRERSNDDYVSSNYEDIDEFDMIENWTELKSGDFEQYNHLRSVISNTSTTYEEISKLIDVDNFMKMFITEVWCFNEDFPGNNIVMWRPRTKDGKWRWILKDIDFVGLVHNYDEDDNYFDYIFRTNDHADDNIIQNSEYAIELFKFMMGFDEFREDFINTSMVYMGDFLKSSYTINLFSEMSEVFASEYPHHLETYDYFGDLNVTMSLYKYYFNQMTSWLDIRNNDLYNHISSYFNLGTPTPLTIDCNDYPVECNGIALTQNNFNGKVFANSELTLKNLSDEETIWKVTYHKANKEKITKVYSNSTMSTSIPEECVEVSIKLMDNIGEVCYIGDFAFIDSSERIIEEVVLYNMSGQVVYTITETTHFKIEKPEKGLYILKIKFTDGGVLYKKIAM